jgi:hypothetical protein
MTFSTVRLSARYFVTASHPKPLPAVCGIRHVDRRPS